MSGKCSCYNGHSLWSWAANRESVEVGWGRNCGLAGNMRYWPCLIFSLTDSYFPHVPCSCSSRFRSELWRYLWCLPPWIRHWFAVALPMLLWRGEVIGLVEMDPRGSGSTWLPSSEVIRLRSQVSLIFWTKPGRLGPKHNKEKPGEVLGTPPWVFQSSWSSWSWSIAGSLGTTLDLAVPWAGMLDIPLG